MAGEYELCTSEGLLAELFDVLSRERFVARLTQAGLAPESIVGELSHVGVVVSTPATPPRGAQGSP